MAGPWHIWIDRGGTFTDCVGRDPNTGLLRAVKLLSSDRAPLLGIRRLLGLGDEAALPPCRVRMGTTLATNALLERRGAACGLAISRGFGDLLAIGDQTRPELFALAIAPRPQLQQAVLEVDARLAADGAVLLRPEPAGLRAELRALRATGLRSLAVAVLHAHRDGALERGIGEAALAAGFEHVTLSHEVAGAQGFLARVETAVVDAYLTPLLRDYVALLTSELPGSLLQIMQSSGDLTPARRFRGRDAVLSGPAGGVVACAALARELGLTQVIGFDMGGTSTDVSHFDGEYERAFETEVAGVRMRAPMMRIHTVAAGGGSICRVEAGRLTVGPESAGADPGPLCYGREAATALTITDVNLALGRLSGARFPFALAPGRVTAALERLDDGAGRGRQRARADAGRRGPAPGRRRAHGGGDPRGVAAPRARRPRPRDDRVRRRRGPARVRGGPPARGAHAGVPPARGGALGLWHGRRAGRLARRTGRGSGRARRRGAGGDGALFSRARGARAGRAGGGVRRRRGRASRARSASWSRCAASTSAIRARTRRRPSRWWATRRRWWGPSRTSTGGCSATRGWVTRSSW